MGNLTHDVELKYTPKGTATADISLAINHHYTTDGGEKREEVTFVSVTLWGRTAEIVGEYCQKGSPLFVEGRLKLDQWEDKQSGQKRSKLKVIGENVQLIGAKPQGDREERPPSRGRGKPPERPKPEPELEGEPDDTVPF